MTATLIRRCCMCKRHWSQCRNEWFHPGFEVNPKYFEFTDGFCEECLEVQHADIERRRAEREAANHGIQ